MRPGKPTEDDNNEHKVSVLSVLECEMVFSTPLLCHSLALRHPLVPIDPWAPINPGKGPAGDCS
jgi:hypothetical protein